MNEHPIGVCMKCNKLFMECSCRHYVGALPNESVSEIQALRDRVKELEDFIEAEGRCLLVPSCDTIKDAPT